MGILDRHPKASQQSATITLERCHFSVDLMFEMHFHMLFFWNSDLTGKVVYIHTIPSVLDIRDSPGTFDIKDFMKFYVKRQENGDMSKPTCKFSVDEEIIMSYAQFETSTGVVRHYPSIDLTECASSNRECVVHFSGIISRMKIIKSNLRLILNFQHPFGLGMVEITDNSQ